MKTQKNTKPDTKTSTSPSTKSIGPRQCSLDGEAARILRRGGNFTETKNPTHFEGHPKLGCRCRPPYFTDDNGQRVPDLTDSCHHIVNRLMWWMACADWSLADVLEAASDYDNRGMRWAQSDGVTETKLTGMYAHQVEAVAVSRSKASKTQGGSRHPSGRKRSQSAATRALNDAFKFQPGGWAKILGYIEANPTHGRNQIRIAMRPWRNGHTDRYLAEAHARAYITSWVVDGRGKKKNYSVQAWPTALAPRYSVALRAAVDALPEPVDMFAVDLETPETDQCSQENNGDVGSTPWIVIGPVSKTSYWPSQEVVAEGKTLGLPHSEMNHMSPPASTPKKSKKKIPEYRPTPEAQALLNLEEVYYGEAAKTVQAKILEYANNL